MDPLQRRLMLRESNRRLESARLLKTAGDTSDSAYLLELLAFELLLKLLVEERTGKSAPRHHRYAEIFELLPLGVRREVLERAAARIGPSALSSDPNAVLHELAKNFVELRYPHQKYIGHSEDEYLALGERWLEEGAPLERATFRYYPEELLGLLHAAREVVNP